MKLVTEDRIRTLVKEPEALEAVETAFASISRGKVIQPPPLGMEIPRVRGEVHVKGAYLEGEPIFAMKVASGFYKNPERGLPTGSGLVLVFDAATGFPLALLQDNGYLTELRTGAAGALAVKLLAPDVPLEVAVLGAGSQARYQLRAMSRVRTLKRIRVWSPVDSEVFHYAHEMEPRLQVPITPASSPEAAVTGAHLVVTVTPSRTPLIEWAWLRPGVTVVAVGSDGPDKQELKVDVLANAQKVVVDSRAQCLKLGETHHAVAAGVMAPDDIHGELGEVLLGSRSGREGNETIVVDLTGVGAQDAGMAGVVWKKLESQGG